MKHTRINNSLWVKGWVGLIILLSPFIGNVRGSLSDTIETPRYFYRWFPVRPIDAVSNECRLAAGEVISCEIPGQSALKITGIPDPSNLTIQRVFYTGSGTKAASIRVPISGTWHDHSVELPTYPGSGQTFLITAHAELSDVGFYRLVRYAVGQYWWNIYSDTAQLIHQGKWDVLDGVSVDEPYHYMGLWCTQLHNILKLDHESDFPDRDLVDPIRSQLIYELILSGRLMDREDTVTKPLDVKGCPFRHDQVEGVIQSGNTDLEVTGPALVDLDLRCVWPEKSTETRREILFQIVLDDVLLGADRLTVGLDTGTRRWIPRSVPHVFDIPERSQEDTIQKSQTRFSLSHPITIYIPSGNHSLKLVTNESYWIACDLTHPTHNWPPMIAPPNSSQTIIEHAFTSYPDTIENLCTLGLSLLPDDRKGDIGWLNSQLEPDHVLINRAYQHQRNGMVWEPVEGDNRDWWFLDPPDSILEIHQESRSDSFANIYPIPPHQDVVIDVEGSDEWVSVWFYDLENSSGSDPLELEIDGRSRIIKEQVGAQRPAPRYSLAMSPGQHTIRLKTMDRPILCSMPIRGVEGIARHLRAYAQLPISSDQTFNTICDGGPYGRELRLIWRPKYSGVQEGMLSISLDHSKTSMIVCSTTADVSWGAGCVMTIPPGRHALTISPYDVPGSYINLALSRSDQPNQSLASVPDPGLIHLEQFATAHDVSVESGFRFDTIPIQHRILLLADHGDSGSAWQLLHEKALPSDAVSTRILIGYLRWKSGYPNSAVKIWTDIETETGQQWDWLNHWIMSAAMAAHNPITAWNRSISILQENPVDIPAQLVQGRCLLHFNQPRAAEAILNAIRLNSQISAQDSIEYDDGIDQLMEMITRFDPTAGFSTDWAFFSPNPNFMTVNPSELTGDGVDTALISQETDLLAISEGHTGWNSKDQTLIREGEKVQYGVHGPTQIKILARPGHRSKDGIFQTFSFEVSIGDRTMWFSFPRNQEDRSDRFFMGLEGIRPGLPEQVLIPVPADEATVSIQCTSGLGSIELKYQIPGIDDHPGSSPDPEAASRYLMALALLKHTDSDRQKYDIDVLRSFALNQSIRVSHPRCEAVETLSEYLRERIQWKWLDGWVEMDSDHVEVQRITTTEIQHDPIVTLRGALLDSPNPDVPEYILTTRQTLRFDLSNVHSRTLQCRISTAFLPKQRYRVRVLNGNRRVGELGPDQQELSIRLLPQNTKDVTFDLESLADSQLVKLAVWSPEDPSHILPILNSRSFQVLGLNGELEMPLFGPTVVRIESRLWNADNRSVPRETSVRVTIRDSDSQFLNEHILGCSLAPDVGSAAADGRIQVGCPVFLELPLPECQKYVIQFSTMERTGLPVLIRLTAAMDRKLDPVNHAFEWAPSQDFLKPEPSSQPIVSTLPDREWKSPVPRHLDIKNQSGGTWKMELVGRYRDNNPELDGDIYVSDGYSLLMGYQRRFEGKGLYFDGDIGITHPSDEPDDPMVSLNQIWNLNTAIYDFRSQLVINGCYQEIQEQLEHSHEIRYSIMRSFHPKFRWSLIPSLSLFYIGQSLSPEEVAGLDTLPEPGIFNPFDHDFDSGVSAEATIRHEPLNWFRWYLRGKTMTAGSHESSVLGPCWMETGMKGVIGPILWEVSYTKRSAFSESMTPDRTRITASVTLFRWMGDSSLMEFQIWDRFTTETEWNEFQVAVVVRWNTGRLLRDRDPNRIEFKDHIENLYRLSSEGDYDKK